MIGKELIGELSCARTILVRKHTVTQFLPSGGCAPILAKCTNQSMDSMMGGEGGMMMGGDSEPRNKRGSAAPYSGPTPYSVLPTQMASICG